MSFVLARSALAVGRVSWGKRQEGSAFHLTDGYIGVGEEGVELLHKVLADQVRKVDLVKRVAEHGKEYLLEKVRKCRNG